MRASRPAPIITDGLEVFVQLVIAAITTWPWSSSTAVPSASVTGIAVTPAAAAADPAGDSCACPGAAVRAATVAWPA